MKEIRKLDVRRSENESRGHRYSIFECPICKKHVERVTYRGLSSETCGKECSVVIRKGNASQKVIRTCEVKFCKSKYYSKGYCNTHYANFLKHGNPHAPIRSKSISFVVNENGCYICDSHATNKDGYPMINFNGKTWIGSRFIYTEMFGKIPKGLVIRHKCDDPGCINPEHLETGTILQNARDAVERNRNSKGSKRWNAKLIEEQVREIKRMLAQGISNNDIADVFKINFRVVSSIRNKRTWRDVEI